MELIESKRQETLAERAGNEDKFVTSLSKFLGDGVERLNEQIEYARQAALDSDWPVPSVAARQCAIVLQNGLLIRAFTTANVELSRLDIDAFASAEGGVVLTVDYGPKRLTARIAPSGQETSVTKVGPNGFEDRALVLDDHGLLQVFRWLVRAA